MNDKNEHRVNKCILQNVCLDCSDFIQEEIRDCGKCVVDKLRQQIKERKVE